MRSKINLFLIMIIALLPFLAGCGSKAGTSSDPLKPITLKYWRVWDEEDAFRTVFDKYKAIHPNVKIEYRKLRYDEYEQALLEAFATGRGPDIISIENSWIRKYNENGLIAPMPATIRHSYPVASGKVKKKIAYEIQTRNTLPLNQLRSKFVDVVYSDVVIGSKSSKTAQYSESIYGLPLYLDTLGMFYNKDLFNNAGISSPPEFWDKDFQQTVKKLTKQNSKGQIIQSGIAMGGSMNIDRSSDILSLLMMQNGTEMMNEGGQITFHLVPDIYKEKRYYPGIEALRFYTDFANPAKDVYCWNDSMENALDLFAQNKVGMFFGYSYNLPQIKAKARK
jgi:multiple sugar transport system substrate-binding protein